MTNTTETITRCRYLRRNEQQCTGEALDPDAEVLLCTKHAARVMAFIRARATGQATGRPSTVRPEEIS